MHSRQKGRLRSSAARFQNTIRESLHRFPLENALAKIGIVDAQKIATGSIKRSRRPEVVAIILVQLAAGMKSDFIDHSREIAHSFRHFFWAFWIRRHSRVIAVSLYSCNSSG